MAKTTFGILLFTFYLSLFTSPARAITNPISYKITVSATIGESKLTLFGWTSPQSLVELQGQRVSESVIANEQGYFFFDRILLPAPRSSQSEVEPTYPELCLASIDSLSRASFPTCLPPLPLGSFDMSIGPVLLPPTLSLFTVRTFGRAQSKPLSNLSKGSFLPNEQAIAQDLTIPNSEVNIFLANNLTHSLRFSFIPSVYAYFIPRYQIKADANGHFEFNLPASKAEWKIFAAATHLGSPSPKSNTLTFRILGWWEWLWEQIKLILGLIVGLAKPYWWQILIGVEIVVVILLLTKANFHSLR